MGPFAIVLLRSLRRLLPLALGVAAGCASAPREVADAAGSESAPREVADDAGACLPGVGTGTPCANHGCAMVNTGQCVAPVCYCRSGQLWCNFEHNCLDGGGDSGGAPDADASSRLDVFADEPTTDAAAE